MSNLEHTFRFIAQNLQSDADGGRTWLTISRFTGTCSFFNEADNLDDSLIAITFKWNWHEWVFQSASSIPANTLNLSIEKLLDK